MRADAIDFYKTARERLNRTPFQVEIQWQAGRNILELSEPDLLRETAWVILCSGFREAIVRDLFSFISLCFCEWESALVICENADLCRATALAAFGNRRKINAIVDTAHYVADLGFNVYKRMILEDPVATLRSLPYIGGITVYHLAKNIGIDVAKPDRHLSRFAEAHGFRDAHALCAAISQATGDPQRVVDVVLWRALVQQNQPRNSSADQRNLANARPGPFGY